MSRVHDPNIFVSSAVENTVTNEDDNDIFGTPLGDRTDPFTPQVRPDVKNEIDRRKLENMYLDTYLKVAGARQSLRRSTSDLTLSARTRQSDESFQTAIRVDAAQEPLPHTPSPNRISMSLHIPRRPLRRTYSNSRLESQFRYHDPNIDSATLQKRLSNQIKRNGQAPLRPWRVRRARASSGPFTWTDPRSPRPGFKWFPLRSKSDCTSLSQISKDSRRNARKMPLKSSMKLKSKSATASPPSTATTVPNTPEELHQQLRRVKTVDFEDAIARRLISQPLRLWSNDSSHDITSEEVEATTYTKKKKKGSKPTEVTHTPLYPNSDIKSKAADPAVTRTDVHVVAIAPCWNHEDTAEEGGIDPATPTMQIVESKSGCFEVIWDDVPAECEIRARRTSSSASQALHTIGTTTSRRLERVSTKLTQWNFGNRDQRELFKAQVVVFPDEDSRHNATDCAVADDDDEEDTELIAPPNSERTSATQSRFASRSTSTGNASHDDSNSQTSSIPEVVVTLAVPDPDAPPSSPPGAGRSTKQIAAPRRLSNVDEAEMKFRGHRDSMTLEHNRMLRGGGVSPELFMHRDSVSMAKKRMHARNHAISESRSTSRRLVSSSDPLEPIQSRSISSDMPSPPRVKEHATKALKSSVSASMLRSQPAGIKRHIQIVE